MDALCALEITSGYKSELVTVEAGGSIAADRQRGMKSCHADYKIYMVDCYRANPNISLVAFYRACIDINGQRIPDFPWAKPLTKDDILISGKDFGRQILMQMTNIIGELTTCLIKNQICLMEI